MKRFMAVASSMAFALAVVVVMMCGLVGCGGGASAPGQAPVVAPAKNTGAVRLRIDMNQQAVYKAAAPTAKAVSKKTAKTAASKMAVAKMTKGAAKIAALAPQESQVVNLLKGDVTRVRIVVNTMDWNEVLSLNEPMVNGVFDSTRPDGTSMINLPEGDYQIYIGLENACDEGRFYGWTDVHVMAGQENMATVDLEVSPVEVGVAIANFQGNFDKGDGSDSTPHYSGSAVTDDWMEYREDEFAWVDAAGTLHATISVDPLYSTKAWITVKDKDGASIVQAFDINMVTYIENAIGHQETPYVFQKTNGVTVQVNFPS